MANAIMTNLENDTPTHIMAHSQGALITSNALTLVKNQLDHDAQLPGAAGAEARQLLGRYNNIKVETFGGAAASYPKGPKYVHYINTRDPVAMGAGLPIHDDFILHDINADSRPSVFNPFDRGLQNAAGGEGAVVHYIRDYRGGLTDPFANHDFMESGNPNLESGGYIAQRVPFDEAQRSQFHDVDTGLPN